jgi:hypothetical protein
MLNTGLINYTQTSSSVGTNFLKLAANMSTTLQNVQDNNGSSSPLKISTQRIALGTATGTSLLNFPDAGTTAADGISFGTGVSLYRLNSTNIANNGSFACNNYNSLNFAGVINFGGCSSVTVNPNTLTGSSATSALSITQTHNTTGSPDVIKIDIVNTASGANTRYLNFYTSGTSQFSMDRLGNMFYLNNGSISSASGSFTMNHGGVQYFRSNSLGTNIGTGGLVASARLSVESTTQGFLPPRMTTAQRDLIATPAEGLMIYNTSTNKPNFFDGTSWVHF